MPDNPAILFFDRDILSMVLAQEHCITSKAVLDVWKLRTWAWVTMLYWTKQDLDFFLTKHLCVACRKKGVLSLQVCPPPNSPPLNPKYEDSPPVHLRGVSHGRDCAHALICVCHQAYHVIFDCRVCSRLFAQD